jgi:phytoene dehydrogenase-like protein
MGTAAAPIYNTESREVQEGEVVAAKFDAIIIGAGHNGLVTACYLAKARWKVLVLERRHVVGGACVTEEVFPGFKVSTAAYVNSLFRPEIIRDLRLADHGFALLERSPSSFTPMLDGRYLMMGPDREMTLREIAKFSGRDAENYPKYEAMLERVAGVIEPTLIMRPPNVLSPGFRDLWNLFKLHRKFKALGTSGMSEALEILTGPARPILERWFESEPLRSTLATDAIIGAMAAPSMPGTAYVLFHHVMGETNGKKGVWAYVKGGMGGLTQALASVARQLGVEIRTEAPVGRILVKGGAVTGVALQSGTEFDARVVASNVDANLTFNKMLDPRLLPPDFADAISRIRYDSASLKINVALSELPQFACLPGNQAGPQHRGTVHICADLDAIERAYDDAKYGRPSQEPILECTLPSAVDPSVAPAGKHLMSMFVQYAPYDLRGGNWDDIKDQFADRCFDLLDRYAPNFKRSVIARQVLSPLDLERTFGLTGGNIFQGAMTLNQLFSMRPVVGHAGYRTPIKGLFLCGSAAHPGGGVIGAAGWNAAREIMGRL